MHARIAEIKAHCPDPDTTTNRIIELGATHQGRDHQIDTYFKVSHGRLKLRQGGIETNLIHYHRDDRAGPKDSHVLLHAPSDGDTLKATLSAALDVLVVVDKQRNIYWHGNVKFHLDHVAGLGAFVEIEAIDRDGSRTREQLHDQCRHWMSTLHIDAGSLITQSYSDLLLGGISELPDPAADGGQETVIDPQPELHVAPVRARDPQVMSLLDALTTELARSGYTEDESFGYSVEQLEHSAVHLVGARVEDRLAGLGGLERRDRATGELKRFFVAPEYRGRGVADAMLGELVAYARGHGLARLQLETGDKQYAAIAFYHRHGFVQVPRFGPYLHSATSVCMQRDLD